MYMATNQNEIFLYYPYLSDMTGGYDMIEE